ncbi:MAG: hypothetical protein LBU64_08950 [Planctomycetota bacterium]|nr:hypothetical protein [Planctomycetota bacterium]
MGLIFFKSHDEFAPMDFVYHTPGKLIGFADLLLRRPGMSFYPVPFFAVLRTVGEVPGFYPHLLEAYSIGFSQVLDAKRKTTAESLMIYLRCQYPQWFRLRYEHPFDAFDMLYFLREEVEAIEKSHPECRIVNPVHSGQDPLAVTTRKNISKVAAKTLYRLASCHPLPEESPGTFRLGFLSSKASWWSEERGGEDTFPIEFCPKSRKRKSDPTFPSNSPKT